MTRVSTADALARAAISLAEDRRGWPAREDWQEGPDPRQMPGLYDEDPDQDEDPDGDGEDLEWTPLR
jgi:hypothetical protein